MQFQVKIAVVAGTLVLAASPAALAAGKPDGTPPYGKGAANGQGPTYRPADPTPGPKAGLPAQAKAYGRYCQGESKKHVKGEKGTAFSRCVRNMAEAATQEHKSPGQVCKGESKKHVKGEKGTAFSRCVTAAAKLREDQEGDSPQ